MYLIMGWFANVSDCRIFEILRNIYLFSSSWLCPVGCRSFVRWKKYKNEYYVIFRQFNTLANQLMMRYIRHKWCIVKFSQQFLDRVNVFQVSPLRSFENLVSGWYSILMKLIWGVTGFQRLMILWQNFNPHGKGVENLEIVIMIIIMFACL